MKLNAFKSEVAVLPQILLEDDVEEHENEQSNESDNDFFKPIETQNKMQEMPFNPIKKAHIMESKSST